MYKICAQTCANEVPWTVSKTFSPADKVFSPEMKKNLESEWEARDLSAEFKCEKCTCDAMETSERAEREATSCFQTLHAAAPCYCRPWRCCLPHLGRITSNFAAGGGTAAAGVRTLVTREKSNYSWRQNPPLSWAVRRSAWGSKVTRFHRG